MKTTIYEMISRHGALDRRMFCSNCGSHMFNIHHEVMPEDLYWIECDECHFESEPRATKKQAIKEWQNL